MATGDFFLSIFQLLLLYVKKYEACPKQERPVRFGRDRWKRQCLRWALVDAMKCLKAILVNWNASCTWTYKVLVQRSMRSPSAQEVLKCSFQIYASKRRYHIMFRREQASRWWFKSVVHLSIVLWFSRAEALLRERRERKSLRGSFATLAYLATWCVLRIEPLLQCPLSIHPPCRGNEWKHLGSCFFSFLFFSFSFVHGFFSRSQASGRVEGKKKLPTLSTREGTDLTTEHWERYTHARNIREQRQFQLKKRLTDHVIPTQGASNTCLSLHNLVDN